MTEKKATVQITKPSFKLPTSKFLSFLTNLLTSQQNIIGIDIGSSYVKILQLQKSGRNYLIRNCITRALTQAAKDNPEEKRKLTREFMQKFIADARIKTPLGRLAISGKGIFIFSLVVPNLNKKDLRSAVSIELKKRLPFQLDINNVSFDFSVTGQLRDERGVVLQVTCIAADHITLDEQVQLLKGINIRPEAINTIPDCLGNLLPFCFDTLPKKTVTILDMGANTSLLNFYNNKNLVFSREIPIGGEHLTQAMAKTINTASATVTINAEDAEKLKRNCGIPLEDESKEEFLTDFGPLRGEQITAMLRPTLEKLVMEISRTFSYYSKTFKAPNIDELYLTGGTSRMKNINKFLLFNLEGVQKVKPLNILKAVKGWTDMGVLRQELIVEEAAPYLAVALGLCLATGGKVNLLPLKEKLEQKALLLSTALKVTFPIILLISLIFYAVSYTNALKYKLLINNLDSEINRLESSASLVREYQEMKTKLEQRKELLEKAKGKQPFWWGIFKELSNISPREVILQKIITDSTKAPKEIHLLGKIYAKYTFVDMALSQYLMVLGESPFFKRVELISSKTDMYSPIPAADFEIVCQLNY